MTQAAATRRHVPLEGCKITVVDGETVVGDSQLRVERVGRDVIRRARAGNLRIPMLPAAATQALALANDPDATLQGLMEVIEPDPLLSARMLTIANSPAYSTGVSVSSLNKAAMRLGTGNLRDMLYQAVAEAHIFRGADASWLDQIRRRSVADAHISRMICRTLGIGIDYALLCGLLHDLGAIILRQMFAHELPEELEPAEVDEVIDLIHPHIGAEACRIWKLPKLVGEAARCHHNYRGFDGGDGYSDVGNIVAAAERIAEHHGIGLDPRPIPEEGDACLYDLQLTGEQVVDLIAQSAALAKGERDQPVRSRT